MWFHRGHIAHAAHGAVSQSDRRFPLAAKGEPPYDESAPQTMNTARHLFFLLLATAIVGAQVPAETPAKPSAQDPATPVGKQGAVVEIAAFNAGQILAKLEVEDATLKPLSKEEQITGAPEMVITWTTIPVPLQGLQFTKAAKMTLPLRFKVLTDGVVYMACTSRFRNAGLSGGAWEKEVISEEELLKAGWKKHRALELKDSDEEKGHHVWWVFSRECKAGESFSYRTEKYITPVLLAK